MLLHNLRRSSILLCILQNLFYFKLIFLTVINKKCVNFSPSMGIPIPKFFLKLIASFKTLDTFFWKFVNFIFITVGNFLNIFHRSTSILIFNCFLCLLWLGREVPSFNYRYSLKVSFHFIDLQSQSYEWNDVYEFWRLDPAIRGTVMVSYENLKLKNKKIKKFWKKV